MDVVCPASVWEELAADASARAPREACGVVIGRRDAERVTATRYVALANVADHGFALRPIDLAAADADAREAGLELVGLFHSHPSGDLRPSRSDLAAPWPAPTAWIGHVGARGVRVAVWQRDADGTLVPARLRVVPHRDP